MAALRGTVQGERGEVSRLAHHALTSNLETWHGAIKTELGKDGQFAVYIGSKGHADVLIARGNVNDGERSVQHTDVDGRRPLSHTQF